VVKALKAGSATITVTTTTSQRSASCTVTVLPFAVVTTLAGSTSSGFLDGTGTAAKFNTPAGIAVDSSGTIYVADTYNNRIRKISSAGSVSTLAGSGSSTSVDGTGIGASFYNPTGLAVDSSGNVYVADYSTHKIRKVSPAGVVTTLAGTGSSGSNDGAGAVATFKNPQGLAVDSSGNVYVADYGNYKIRKVSPAGVVTTLAGSGAYGHADGTGATASFYYPKSVAVDGSGNVYVADTSNYMIRKISPAGVVTTLAGSSSYSYSSTDGTGTSATFASPASVAVDSSGILYVVDSYTSKIRRISPEGVVTTIAGSGSSYSSLDGNDTASAFNSASGIAVGQSHTLYVSEYYKIRKIALAE
jgi:sugar lactone lactonase YvrE